MANCALASAALSLRQALLPSRAVSAPKSLPHVRVGGVFLLLWCLGHAHLLYGFCVPHQMLARIHALPFVVEEPFVRQTEVRRQGNAEKNSQKI